MADPIRRSLEQLRARGAPDFFERDTTVLTNRYKARFESETGRTLYDGQTEMFIIELLAYAHSLYNEAAQVATEQNTAVFAEGIYLENKGTDVQTFKLLPQSATCTLVFSLAEAQAAQVTIAAGSRVSDAGQRIFATTRDLVIPAGDLDGAVQAVAQNPGSAANAIAIDGLNTLIDPIPSIASVRNIDVTSGGSDEEEQERYRLRVINGLEKVAKTGPRAGYRERVKSVHPDIVDVDVHRAQPGFIHISPLMVDGLPSSELKSAILEALDPEDEVAMGDFISIHDPVDWRASPSVLVRCLAAIPFLEEKIRHAIFVSTLSWTQQLGPQIAPSCIIAEIKKIPGVTDVAITDLEFTDLAHNAFPVFDAWTVTVEVTPDV